MCVLSLLVQVGVLFCFVLRLKRPTFTFEDTPPYSDGNTTLICQEIQASSCIDAAFTVERPL